MLKSFKVRERRILEITFAKVYGVIDDYAGFTQNIIQKLYSQHLISKETREELCGEKYETKWEKNRLVIHASSYLFNTKVIVNANAIRSAKEEKCMYVPVCVPSRCVRSCMSTHNLKIFCAHIFHRNCLF